MRISDWSSDVCSSDLVKSATLNAACVIARTPLPLLRRRLPSMMRSKSPSMSKKVWHSPGKRQARNTVLTSLAKSCATEVERPVWTLLGRFTCRSEEHTSELQSLMRISYAVFCLKKKNHISCILTDYRY